MRRYVFLWHRQHKSDGFSGQVRPTAQERLSGGPVTRSDEKLNREREVTACAQTGN